MFNYIGIIHDTSGIIEGMEFREFIDSLSDEDRDRVLELRKKIKEQERLLENREELLKQAKFALEVCKGIDLRGLTNPANTLQLNRLRDKIPAKEEEYLVTSSSCDKLKREYRELIDRLKGRGGSTEEEATVSETDSSFGDDCTSDDAPTVTVRSKVQEEGGGEELMSIIDRIGDNIRGRNNGEFDNAKVGRPMREIYSHYHKEVPEGVTHIDTYTVNRMFNVTDPTGCTQHAVKKLLVSGERGYKDSSKDYVEAIVTLIRGGELRDILQVEGNLEEGMYIKLK